MSDEQQSFDPERPLTRRELRAMLRQQEGLGESESSTEAGSPEPLTNSEDFFTTRPEPVIEPAPTPPPVTPVFNQEFKFVAPDLVSEQPVVDTGFQAPYRYVPGGATASANQADLPATPEAAATAVPEVPVSASSIPAEAPVIPPTSSFMSQPSVEVPETFTSAPAPEPTPAAPVPVAEPMRQTESAPEAKVEINDGTDGLFRIPSNLTGEVATASIVIENSTNPLDIIAGTSTGTGSIPIVRTGSIDIQNPETRAASTTGSIRTQPSTDTSPSTAIITPLKSQTIALTGELGHQRGVRFKPVDPQKYWVLGIGVLMVVVGAGFLASFLFGYVK